VDASPEALALARENAAATGLAIELVQADLFDGLPPGPFDLVVSNPPYVGAAEVGELEPEVRDWEPRHAIVGAGALEAVVRAAPAVLRAGGPLVLEVGDGQAPTVARLLAEVGFDEVAVSPDLAGRDRVVEGRWTT
jgi:release factor glutamine methyltransferase